MSFRCPQCKTLTSLDITSSIELPPDSRSDEITLQVVECTDCGFSSLAVYEEPRHAILETDDWKHIGYWVSKDAVESVKAAIHYLPQSVSGTLQLCGTYQSQPAGSAWRLEGIVRNGARAYVLMRMAVVE